MVVSRSNVFLFLLRQSLFVFSFLFDNLCLFSVSIFVGVFTARSFLCRRLLFLCVIVIFFSNHNIEFSKIETRFAKIDRWPAAFETLGQLLIHLNFSRRIILVDKCAAGHLTSTLLEEHGEINAIPLFFVLVMRTLRLLPGIGLPRKLSTLCLMLSPSDSVSNSPSRLALLQSKREKKKVWIFS